ncbi:endo alpha-1,4 polygalactosaminidase [Salana multivorans]
MAILRRVLAVCSAAVTLAACGQAAALPSMPPRTIEQPPATGAFDYQLSGAYEPAPEVAIVVRDNGDPIADGRYNVCYVNGFQTQPGEADQWDGLLVTDEEGNPLADPGWPDELILDTSTAANRERITELQQPLVDRCAEAGFAAVEYDNLDSYLRSHGATTPQDNLALAELLVRRAHAAGLAVAQKNAVELVDAGREAGFDFAITESCGRYEECDGYQAAFDVVLDIEYVTGDEYQAMCAAGILPDRSVLRDVQLTTPGHPDHVLAYCE